MAATTVQAERERLVKASRATAWVMLATGTLVTIAGFVIQSEYGGVHWNYRNHYHSRCLPRITVPMVGEQYWCGFLVRAFMIPFFVIINIKIQNFNCRFSGCRLAVQKARQLSEKVN